MIRLHSDFDVIGPSKNQNFFPNNLKPLTQMFFFFEEYMRYNLRDLCLNGNLGEWLSIIAICEDSKALLLWSVPQIPTTFDDNINYLIRGQ